MTSKKPTPECSRRLFLQTAGGATVAGSLGAGSARAATDEPSAGTALPVAHSKITAHKRLDYDVVVIGGGLAGVSAAISAARNGARVALVQDRPVLGGNSSSEVRLHVLGADAFGRRKDTDSRESGLIEELRLEEAIRNPQKSYNIWDLLLYEWARSEPNLTLFLNTHCLGVEMASETQIAAALVSRPSTEDVMTLRAGLFIDCSGDGRLGAEAGAEYRHGREAHSLYGESFAPSEADNDTLGSALLFMTKEYDRPMPYEPPYWIREIPKAGLPYRKIEGWEWGFWWCSYGGELNTIKDNEAIRDELLAAALGIWDHIKNSGKYPDSENWALDWVGAIPGKRESRRFMGDHVLIQQEIQRGETFDDGVAYGGWPIDLHPAKGIWSSEPPCDQTWVPLYNIPLGSLYSRNIQNLLFAGRNISASHVGFGSTRVMSTGSVMGMAVGTAAALCAEHGCIPRELRRDGIKELQQLLLKNDAYIIGGVNEDPYDFARKSIVRASSVFSGETTPENATNGITRRVYTRSNQWRSAEGDGSPWIELRFDEPKRVREVHLTFDTGLNRRLCLSHTSVQGGDTFRGPQPETARDYELLALHGESSKPLLKVEGNYYRKRVHRFDPETVDGIRLRIDATNGGPTANLFEIRTYG